MTDADLVSVVMPVWQPRRDWLHEAVRSVLDQRRSEIELVVVDDGCDEPVASLLAGVDDPRLRIVRIPHAGVSQARNAGVEAARGAWIRYADADDVLEPESTCHLLALARRGGIVAYGATVWCDEELHEGPTLVTDVQGSAVEACLLDRFPVTLPTLLFPRWVVTRVGAWDREIVVCQDWDYMLRAFEIAEVRGDHRVALFYRRHPAGASAGSLGSPESLGRGEDGMRRVVHKYFERHPEQRGTELERRARATVELVMARSHREAYLRYLGAALRDDRSGVVRELLGLGRSLASRIVIRGRRALARVESP